LRVLGVDVEDGIFEHSDGRDGIDVLPEEMAGIEVERSLNIAFGL
jgi:hypothetical protein